MLESETILIVDYGSQYTQLIARKIREQHVYCLVHPYNKIGSKLLTNKNHCNRHFRTKNKSPSNKFL